MYVMETDLTMAGTIVTSWPLKQPQESVQEERVWFRRTDLYELIKQDNPVAISL